MTLIADAKTALTNGATAATIAKSTAAAGPIQDPIGLANLYLTKLQELHNLLTQMVAGTDAGDPNLTLFNSAITSIG